MPRKIGTLQSLTPPARSFRRLFKKKDMEIIKLRGILVDILCKISSYYKAYVTRSKRGVKQFLLRCQNSLYGSMLASLLYYRKFTNSLTILVFEINPYVMCVDNKVIDSSQMSICFHVDDCKLINRESKANNCMIKWLR